jgi:hypothetical protein
MHIQATLPVAGEFVGVNVSTFLRQLGPAKP